MANEFLAKSGIIVTGSIEVQNAVTASAFSGDGSALTNTPQIDISALNIFTGSIQTQVNILEATTASFATTGSNTFIGTQRSLYTTTSIVYNGSNITQVTSSFTNGIEQITNITYDGSNVDNIVISGSDGINKIYTLSYDGSGNVTNIIIS
tara:strand:- start:1003 stop:1455 length:453 start_codon:yes stop_codon:yes gene_type:complete